MSQSSQIVADAAAVTSLNSGDNAVGKLCGVLIIFLNMLILTYLDVSTFFPSLYRPRLHCSGESAVHACHEAAKFSANAAAVTKFRFRYW